MNALNALGPLSTQLQNELVICSFYGARQEYLCQKEHRSIKHGPCTNTTKLLTIIGLLVRSALLELHWSNNHRLFNYIYLKILSFDC